MSTNESDDELSDLVQNLRRMARRAAASKDPSVWLADRRMTQTEVSLRLGAFLIKSRIAANHVWLTLAGYELTRREHPQFPARRYLIERLGFTPDDDDEWEWRGAYSLRGHPHALQLDWDKHAGHVITFLPSGQRLVAFVTSGLLSPSRSPAEHSKFWQVIGRAVTWKEGDPRDVLAVCVPRSERYRHLAAEFREAEGILRSRILMLNVDRTGYVDGLQSLEQKRD